MRANHFADESRGDGLAHIGQMRRPAPVLVDCELDAAPLGLLDERLSGRDVLDERFLRQDMLAGRKGPPHQVDANVGMCGDVENRDAGIAENPFKVVRRFGRGEKCVAPRAGPRQIARADREDVQSVGAVGVEVRRADPAGADERDADRTVSRHRRQIGQVGRRRLDRRLGGQRVIARRRLALCFR